MTESLKSCPFCGEPAGTQLGIYGYRIWIGCKNRSCGMKSSSQFHGEAEAIAAWNRRASPPTPLGGQSLGGGESSSSVADSGGTASPKSDNHNHSEKGGR